MNWCRTYTKPPGVYRFAGNTESSLIYPVKVCRSCIKYASVSWYIAGTTCLFYWNGQSPPNEVKIYYPDCLNMCSNLMTRPDANEACWSVAQQEADLRFGSDADVINIYTSDYNERWSDNCKVVDIRLTGFDYVMNLP